jgi:TetR/AcrR family transcriptional regulator of autoinduction and epiphytic fitness
MGWRSRKSMTPDSAENLDGRLGRKLKSRLAICEACLDLLQDGVLQPSADRVAQRAGVSRRSIFNHFANLAELYDAVFEVGTQRYAPLLGQVSENQPIAERVERLVELRSNFLELTAPITRAFTVQALVEPTREPALRVSRQALQLHHQHLERLFEKELGGLSETERADVIEAMTAVTSAPLWETLRRGREKSIAAAAAIVKRSLRAILRDVGVAA